MLYIKIDKDEKWCNSENTVIREMSTKLDIPSDISIIFNSYRDGSVITNIVTDNMEHEDIDLLDLDPTDIHIRLLVPLTTILKPNNEKIVSTRSFQAEMSKLLKMCIQHAHYYKGEPTLNYDNHDAHSIMKIYKK